MKKKFIVLIAIISMLVTACGQFGDPMPEDMYTRGVYPGYDSIYSVGGNGTEYAEGWFDNLYVGGVLVGTGGGGGNVTVAFNTMNAPAGTDPEADSATDTLNFTSSDGTVTITGNAGTDTLDFVAPGAAGTNAFGTIDVDAGTNPVADASPDTLQLTSHDGSVYVEGNEITDQVSLEVLSDGHSHTGATLSGVDISSDTNLGAHLPIFLSGDWLSLPLIAGHFFVGNTSNEANDVVMGGDGLLTDTGLLIVVGDSHTHTGITLSGVDISDDTNLAVLSPLILTDDTLNIGNVSALTGNLTDPQDAAFHANTHENGGTDEIDVNGLDGNLTDPQQPELHHNIHEDGGGDEISVTGLDGNLTDAQDAALHHNTHEAGGTDVLNVTGLSGNLTDAQDATLHANTHETGGTDVLDLNLIDGTLNTTKGGTGQNSSGWTGFIRTIAGVWQWVASLLPGDITLSDGHLMVGNSSNQANEVEMNGDATMDNTGLVTVLDSDKLDGYHYDELPYMSNDLTSAHIFVGNSTNKAVDMAMTGDVSIDNQGITAVADDSHNHDTTTISGLDISADTNLAVDSPITLTGDTVGIGNASTTAKGAATFDDLYFGASSGNISLINAAVPNSLILGSNFMMVPVNAGWITASSGAGAAVYQQPFRLCVGSGTAAGGYSYAYAYLFGYQGKDANIRYFNFDKKFIFNFNIDKGVVTDGVARIQIKDESVAININDLSMPGIGIEINNADLIWESYGTHRQETDSGINLTAFAKNRITIVLTPGTNRTIKFYVDGVLNYTETDTAHVPSGTSAGSGYLIASLAGGAVHPDNYLSLMEPWMWQDTD